MFFEQVGQYVQEKKLKISYCRGAEEQAAQQPITLLRGFTEEVVLLTMFIVWKIKNVCQTRHRGKQIIYKPISRGEKHEYSRTA